MDNEDDAMDGDRWDAQAERENERDQAREKERKPGQTECWECQAPLEKGDGGLCYDCRIEDQELQNEADVLDRDDGYDDDDRSMFADPGGNSALRAATASNPRNLACPRCKSPNRLTPADRARSYVCDRCADAAERGVDY